MLPSNEARIRLLEWASDHSSLTKLDPADRFSPTFGDLRSAMGSPNKTSDIDIGIDIMDSLYADLMKHDSDVGSDHEIFMVIHKAMVAFGRAKEKPSENND